MLTGKPVLLSTMVLEKEIRVVPEPDSLTYEEALEEIIDMIAYHFDDPSEDDIDECVAALAEELSQEFPGHKALGRRIDDDSAAVVIHGPRYSFRCTVTPETLTVEEE